MNWNEIDHYNDIYNLPNECWKSICGYEGLYEASSFGRIRSVDGKVTFTQRHGKRTWKGRVLKTGGNKKTGKTCDLWKDGKSKDFLVARLVCKIFYPIDNENEMTVNHIDGNRFNNNIKNLEWLTRADNIRHAFDTNLMPTQTNVVLINNKTQEQTTHLSMSKAGKFLGRSNGYISSKLKNNKPITDIYGNVYAVHII